MTQRMRLDYRITPVLYLYYNLFAQPVADRPFTFETELDDLPKEKLKG